MAALRAAEMLKSFSGSTGNPLNALLSFLQPLLEDRDGQRFDSLEFASAVQAAYGWNFTPDVADGFNKMLQERNWLETSRDMSGRVRLDEGKPVHIVRCPPTNDLDVDQPIDRVIERITVAFKTFLTQNDMPMDGVYNDDDDMVAEIVRHLVENFGQTSPGEASLDSSSPEDSETGNYEVDHGDQRSYQVGRFIAETQFGDGPLSSDFDRIAAVGLLAELAQDFAKPTTKVTKVKILIYLDSPIAHDLVGMSGKRAAEQTRSVLRRLNDMGASVCIFDQSVKEMVLSLKTILAKSSFDRFGAIQDAFLSGEIDEAYVHTIVPDPARALREWGVQVKSVVFQNSLKPDHYFSKDQFFRFFDYLVSAHRHDDQRAEVRARHDANAVAYVMRLRKGHESDDLFEAQHVFLTRNRTFTSLARRFCVSEDLISREGVGPFVNMSDLAASVWLRTGLYETSMEIPRRRLLEGCERVLSLKRPVMLKAQRAILSLRGRSDVDAEKVRQIEAILSQDRSRLLISDRVRGSMKDVDGDDLLDIYRRVLADEEVKGYHKGRIEIIEDRDRVLREKEAIERELERIKLQNREALERVSDESQQKLEEISEVSRKKETELNFKLENLRIKMNKSNTEKEDRLNLLMDEIKKDISSKKKQIVCGLMMLSVALFVSSFWKEFASIFSNEVMVERSGLNGRWILFILGIFPALLLVVEQFLKLFGWDRPIENLWIKPWAEKKFLKLADERGLWELLGTDPQENIEYMGDRIVIRNNII